MTTPQRWKEIDEIFAAALDRNSAERPAFLAEACGGDAQLRKEVESLLAHNLPESLFGGLAVHEATRLLEQKAGAGTGDQIGHYRIIRSLGVGGMGRTILFLIQAEVDTVEPVFESLRSDSRFVELMRKVGPPQ
jgi:hypothetical protein